VLADWSLSEALRRTTEAAVVVVRLLHTVQVGLAVAVTAVLQVLLA
jgi:hypothetical protein